MDWEASISDIDFSSNNSQSSDDPDADDEQSDWPEALEIKKTNLYHHYPPQTHVIKSNQRSVENPGIDSTILRKVERFISDSRQQELTLNQVYRTSMIKKIVKHAHSIQILRRGRGTLLLKKA